MNWEIGKDYVTRNGQKLKLVAVSSTGKLAFETLNGCFVSRWGSGRFFDQMECGDDIVAEAKPIKTFGEMDIGEYGEIVEDVTDRYIGNKVYRIPGYVVDIDIDVCWNLNNSIKVRVDGKGKLTIQE